MATKQSDSMIWVQLLKMEGQSKRRKPMSVASTPKIAVKEDYFQENSTCQKKPITCPFYVLQLRMCHSNSFHSSEKNKNKKVHGPSKNTISQHQHKVLFFGAAGKQNSSIHYICMKEYSIPFPFIWRIGDEMSVTTQLAKYTT